MERPEIVPAIRHNGDGLSGQAGMSMSGPISPVEQSGLLASRELSRYEVGPASGLAIGQLLNFEPLLGSLKLGRYQG